MIDCIQGIPETTCRGIELPRNARGLETVGQDIEVETRERSSDVASSIHDQHRRTWGRVAGQFERSRAPKYRLVVHASGLSCHAVKMIGKTGAIDGRKRVVG